MTKTADTSHLMEKEKTKLHPVLVTIKKKNKCLCIQIKIGEISNIFALGRRGGDAHIVFICWAVSWQCPGPSPELIHQSSSFEECVEAWDHQGALNRSCLCLPCQPPSRTSLPAPALVSAGPPHHQGELQGQRRGVWQDFCEPCRLWDSCKGLPAFEPTALLKRNKELKCHCSISTFSLTPD